MVIQTYEKATGDTSYPEKPNVWGSFCNARLYVCTFCSIFS